MKKTNHYFYQPDLIISVIDWCWTFVILLTGIIFWLEVTHFQWITLTFFVLFFLIAGLEVGCRRLVIKGSHLMVFSMFNRRWRSFNLVKDQLTVNKYSICIHQRGRTYRYLMRATAVKSIHHQFQQLNEASL